jgi:hypothetical protein
MESTHQLTLRLPPELVGDLRREAAEAGHSINELAGAVLADHAARQRSLRALDAIARLRRGMERRGGAQFDSVELLRALRRGEGRR